MSHEVAAEQIEAFVLGILEPDAAQQVTRHVAECAACRTAIEEYSGLTGDLAWLGAALAADPHPLPALRLPASEAAARPRASSATRVVERRSGAGLRVAALVLALIAVSAASFWTGRVSHSRAQERQLRQELSGLIEQQEIVLEVVDASDTTKRLLRSTQGTSAYGKVYTRPAVPHLVAMVGRLEPSSDTRSYELILVLPDGAEQRAGQLHVEPFGFGLLVLDTEGAPPRFEGARVVRRDGDSGDAVVLEWRAPSP